MITRFATHQDIPAVCELLKQFSAEARVGFRPWSTEQDTPRIYRLVTRWQQHHYVRVAIQDSQIVGTLIAEQGQDFWDPDRKLLQERAWFVSKSHRGTRAGAQLWQAWDRDANQYLESGRVHAVLLSTQGPDTNFDPGRRGWKLIEQTWMKET
jgi:RimJ/RimL family protein N-acetyltransferase